MVGVNWPVLWVSSKKILVITILFYFKLVQYDTKIYVIVGNIYEKSREGQMYQATGKFGDFSLPIPTG